jgi:hypothetical protein
MTKIKVRVLVPNAGILTNTAPSFLTRGVAVRDCTRRKASERRCATRQALSPRL